MSFPATCRHRPIAIITVTTTTVGTGTAFRRSMLPLHGTPIPANAFDMAASLRQGLERVVQFTAGSNRNAVRTEGEFPRMERLEIDLSETLLLRSPEGEPVGTGHTQPGPIVDRLRIVARPLHCEGVAVEMELTAENVRFQFDVDAKGYALLVPIEAHGRFEGQVPQSGLESLLLSAIREAAEKQSVTIRSTQLTLHQHAGPHTLKAVVRVEATKRFGPFPLSGAFLVTGRLDVGDDLVARVSELACEGEGKLAALIAPLISDRLRKFNHKEMPLAAIPLGDIRLHNLQVGVSDGTLQLHATFGSSSDLVT